MGIGVEPVAVCLALVPKAALRSRTRVDGDSTATCAAGDVVRERGRGAETKEGGVKDDDGGLDGVFMLSGAAEITSGLCASMGVFVAFKNPAWFASVCMPFLPSKQEYESESRRFKIAVEPLSNIAWVNC